MESSGSKMNDEAQLATFPVKKEKKDKKERKTRDDKERKKEERNDDERKAKKQKRKRKKRHRRKEEAGRCKQWLKKAKVYNVILMGLTLCRLMMMSGLS